MRELQVDSWDTLPITLDRQSPMGSHRIGGAEMRADAVEWVDASADRNAHRRDERHPTRQRLLYHAHLLAGGSREIQRNFGWSDTQQLFRGLYIGSVAQRRNYRAGRTYSRLCRLCWLGRRSDRGDADPDRTKLVGDPSCDCRLRLRRSLCHYRELAQREGAAVGAWPGLLE